METNGEKVFRTIDTNEQKIDFIPKSLTLILGSTYCLIILCVLLVIPILELAIGASYQNQCTINPNIPIYLIVAGACGIASIVLTLVIVLAFICIFKQKSVAGSFAALCVIGLIFIFIFFMSSFLFAWFIVGNVWIFGAKQNVDYYNTLSNNYCHPTLYGFAFWILIVSYILAGVSCCASCICSCFQAGKILKN